MSKICIAYITFPSKREAEKIAMKLLNEKLVACFNMFPIESLYRWKGKVEKSKEVVLIAKLLKKNLKRMIKIVKKYHPYTIPFIGVIDVDINKEYFDWMKEVSK